MSGRTWTADNGDGTFTNPLFYEEFSDPDIIRVGEDFYMTGTTMHAMPGLPILKSADLVNWELVTYVFDTLELGPEFRLEGGEIYGQGIWAPCFRYHDGTFYIFSNVNKRRTQIFTATDPAGPWTRREMQQSLHDLSVLFDGHGRAYVVWGYRNLRLAQLTPDLTDLVPGTETEITGADSDMGEGVHFYKIDGRYFLTSAWFSGSMRMPGARADHVFGPWEINPSLSEHEDFGLVEGYRLRGGGLPFTATPPFELIPPNPASEGRMSLHQGGIVDTAAGEWWGWSMMDYNSLGRLTCLSPVTWRDGWPYFGLPGNLGRTPRTSVKPKTRRPQQPKALFERSDDFDGPALQPIWQWNHVPVAEKWSLAERPGHLRLHTLAASSLWDARNSLTQRAVGPISVATTKLDGSGLEQGDVAGLALLGLPYRWVGLRRSDEGWRIGMFDQQTGGTIVAATDGPIVWLRAECDFLTETARLSWSRDGVRFEALGEPVVMVFQLKTFQGIRYALFAYNAERPGGYADFDSIEIDEPHPRGLMRPIPFGETIIVTGHGSDRGIAIEAGAVRMGAPSPLVVVDLGLGRAALGHGGGHLSVDAEGSVRLADGRAGLAETFQWMETPTGELILMSLVTNRFLRLTESGEVRADSPGPRSDGGDRVRFTWVVA